MTDQEESDEDDGDQDEQERSDRLQVRLSHLSDVPTSSKIANKIFLRDSSANFTSTIRATSI